MNDSTLNLVKHYKSFKDIIKKLDVLNNFYDCTYELLENELDSLKEKHQDELFVLKKLDELTSNYKSLDEKKIQEFENIVLSNGEPISSFIKLSLPKDTKANNKDSILVMKKSNRFDLFGVKQMKEDCESKFDILNTSILDRMVSIFEEYLSSIYMVLIVDNPKKYLGERQISLVELLSKNEHPIIHAIESEIESQMYNSLDCLHDIFKKNNISPSSIKNEMEKFEEIYYRRNLFVHNGGIVNSIYLSRVPDSTFKKGDKLICDDSYNKKAFINLTIFLVSLEFCFEKYTNFDGKRINSLSDYGFECLCKGKYEIAEHIYCLLKTKKDIEHVDKLMFFINYLNAKKQLGKNISDDLSTLDVSACSDDFKIAKFCLEDKNKDAYDLINKTYPNSVKASELRDWPIFINFRSTTYYKDFVKEHKNDFEMFNIEKDDTQKSK